LYLIGKLIHSLLKDYDKFFKKVVTHTTRRPRPDEIPGKSYYFVNLPTFQEMIANQSFIEWAQVHGNYYGTSMGSWKTVQEEGKISIFEIDIQGARNIKKVSKEYDLWPRYLFVKPSNIQDLRERLYIRYFTNNL
jgi:guanylate kinase